MEWRISIVDENVLFQDQSARTSVIQDRVGDLELLQSGRDVFPLAPPRISTLTPKPNSNSTITLKHLSLVLLLVHLPLVHLHNLLNHVQHSLTPSAPLGPSSPSLLDRPKDDSRDLLPLYPNGLAAFRFLLQLS